MPKYDDDLDPNKPKDQTSEPSTQDLGSESPSVSDALAKYKLSADLTEINLGANLAGKIDKRATGIYKNLGEIRSVRTGYTVLSCLDYVTQMPKVVFYLPFPDSISIPAETSWSDSSEDGLSGFVGRATENQGAAQSNWSAGNQAAAQTMAKKLADYAPAKAAMRSAGLAYNPNNQMYFNGVNFSAATFTFKLVPKNHIEAEVMYSSAKCILHLSLPGTFANDVLQILKEIWDTAKNFFFKGGDQKSAEDAQDEEAKRQQELLEKSAELRRRTGNVGYISNAQPAFFSYPPLWDISFHIPDGNNDRTVFEWKRLALETSRLDLGGDMKWHSDGLPVSATMNLQMKETILKYSGNINEVMPVIIV